MANHLFQKYFPGGHWNFWVLEFLGASKMATAAVVHIQDWASHKKKLSPTEKALLIYHNLKHWSTELAGKLSESITLMISVLP